MRTEAGAELHFYVVGLIGPGRALGRYLDNYIAAIEAEAMLIGRQAFLAEAPNRKDAEWAELVGIVAKERDDALAEAARLEGLLMVYRPVYEAIVAQRDNPMIAALLARFAT